MDGDFVGVITLLVCIAIFSGFTAMSSFEYFAITRNVSDDEIQNFLNALKFPLNKLYNLTNDSLFYGVHHREILEFLKRKDVLSARFTRWFGSAFCLMILVISIISIVNIQNNLQQIITILVVAAEIVIMVRAWRFGHTLGR